MYPKSEDDKPTAFPEKMRTEENTREEKDFVIRVQPDIQPNAFFAAVIAEELDDEYYDGDYMICSAPLKFPGDPISGEGTCSSNRPVRLPW